MMEHTLVIDQGTHASRCIVFDATGQLMAQSEHPVSIYRQGQQFIEQNPEKILASIYYCIDALKQQDRLKLVTQAALVTQRSTIIGWHKHSGKALSMAISWQDTRASDYLKPLQTQAQEIMNISGLPLSPHYGASKIKWLLENNEACKEAYKKNHLIIAPLSCYLIEQLTGLTDAVVDHVNASRTQLLDINSLNWSDNLLNKFKLDKSILPRLKPCLSEYGQFRHNNFPLKLVTGDQNAAVFANGIPEQDSILINIGTGAFVLKTTSHLEKKSPMLSGLASSSETENTYVLEGTVNGAGAALEQLYTEINHKHLFEQLPKWFNMITHPPLYINTISGLGSPWWNNTIKDFYLNSDNEVLDQSEIDMPEKSVAIIESIVFLLQHNIEQIADSRNSKIIISGGLCKLNGLCQKLADLSTFEVQRFENTEATAKGAAWLLSSNVNWKESSPTACFKPLLNPALQSRFKRFTEQLSELTTEQSKSGVRTV